MKSSQYELSLLVDHKSIREYTHEGSVFVEGRAGSEYKIRIKNNTGTRTCFIVSVDGLSVLNGKQCSTDSPGYILGPWETLDIACYKVDDKTGAKFVFGSKEKSYSVTIGHGDNNVGVIGAMVFREIVKPVHVHRPPPVRPHRRWDDGDYPVRRYGAVKSFGASSLGVNVGALYSANSTVVTNNTGSHGLFEVNTTGSSLSTQSCVRNEPSVAEEWSGVAAASITPENEIEKLGTVFGGAMEWKTETVKFERESGPAVRLEIFYDTRKNLERRGVKLEHKVPRLPNAFPGSEGCTVPDNWQK